MLTDQGAPDVSGGVMPILEVAGIRKSYSGVEVLGGVDLRMLPGEVIALAGENGAGKSTLLKIIAALVPKDAGAIAVDGVPQEHRTVHAARTDGIVFVPQELAPVLDLRVYENIFLGRELRTHLGTLDRGAMVAESDRLLSEFGVDMSSKRLMRHCSTAEQQMVEIIKSTSSGCRILLLDEPTSAISEHEVEHLYDVVRRLRQRGVTMIYTTHRMPEMRAIADRVAVLRDGRLVLDLPMTEIGDNEIVSAMIGRELSGLYPDKVPATAAAVALRIDELVVAPGSPPVTLEVRSGEIVGLAGLMGAGRTELINGIFGVTLRHSGRVLVDGREVRRGSVSGAIRSGMALVPEDRKVGGGVLSMSILTNAYLPRLGRYSVAGWITRRAAVRSVLTAIEPMRVKYASLRQELGRLSGGNQQKVVIARWLTGPVRVLLLDEPTRGVDVGARAEIYRIIADLAHERGLAVLMASSDMPETIGLAHRILVLRGGAIVGELNVQSMEGLDAAQERIFRLSAGLELDIEGEKTDA